jgi:hypothetical protein
MKRPWTQLVCLAILMAAGGCARGPEFAEVEGTLSQGGKPLKNVRVEYWPEIDGPKSTGVTDDQGRYTLKTEDGRTQGAVVGPHKVVLKDLDFYGDKFLGRKAENMPTLNKGAKERFARTYGDAGSTELKKSVSGGQKNVIDLDVK